MSEVHLLAADGSRYKTDDLAHPETLITGPVGDHQVSRATGSREAYKRPDEQPVGVRRQEIETTSIQVETHQANNSREPATRRCKHQAQQEERTEDEDNHDPI